MRAAGLWALVAAMLFSLLYLGAGSHLIAMMTDIEAVRMTAETYLVWSIALPIVSVWCFLLDGIFIGATQTAMLRNAMIFSLLAFLAAVWLLVPAFANHGLWLAFALFMAARGATLAIGMPALGRRVGTVPA